MTTTIPPSPAGQSPKPVKHFNPIELSRRWGISPNTLARWRWIRRGVSWVKVGGKVVYRLEDVEAFERANLHLTNSESPRRR